MNLIEDVPPMTKRGSPPVMPEEAVHAFKNERVVISSMTYTTARPKGFADWEPRSGTMQVLDQVQDVLQTYREHWPLTIRQIFYRLVGAYGYDKTDLAYERLCNYLGRARRARMIPFRAIRDDGLVRRESDCWTDMGQFIGNVKLWAERFTRDKQEMQTFKIYLLAEAGGMVPQLAKVADVFSVPVMSSGGFDSLTVKYDLAMEAKNNNKPTVFLHVGDYDPSGVCIFDSLAADVKAFSDGAATFKRIALLPEHIEQYNLPNIPAKTNDKRGNGVKATCQAEALPPDILAEIVQQAIAGHYDMLQLNIDVAQEYDDRDLLVSRLNQF